MKRKTLLSLSLSWVALVATACDDAEPAASETPQEPAANKTAAAEDAPADAELAKADVHADPPAAEEDDEDEVVIDDDDDAGDAKADDTPDAAADEVAAAEATKTADAPNAAYFDVRDKGIVALTDDGFTTIPDSNVYVARFVHGADGKLYAQTSGKVVEVAPTGLSTVATLDYATVGSVKAIDVGHDGQIWAVGTNGISEYEDGSWTTTPKADAGLADDFEVGLALDADDEPWAATSSSIVHRVDGKWVAASLPKGKTKYLDRMGRGPDGNVYLSTYSDLFRMTGTPGKVAVKKGRFDSPGKFAFSQATLGVARSGLQDVSVFFPADKAARFSGKADLKVGNVSAVAADDSGRVWAAGDGGVAVVGPGAERVTWRSGTFEEIAGQISEMTVRGQGPKLPEAGEVKKGGLEGSVIQDGKPVANAKIELCESPSFMYRRTPCEGSPTHLSGVTDAEGNYEFNDVPLGAYGIAVKVGRKWQVTMGAALGTKMVAGETYDLGSFTVK